MTFQGRVQNGVVVLTNGSPLPEGTLVHVMPVEEAAGPVPVAPGKEAPDAISRERKEALLGLIGICKTDTPPNDAEVEQIIEEYRMKKYG
jgi:hypothetical protein